MPHLFAIEWSSQESLILLDQTKLPNQTHYITCTTPEEVYQAIKRLSVRGAPAIGIAAAYGLCLKSNQIKQKDSNEYKKEIKECALFLKSSRPTAVNLMWAIDQLVDEIESHSSKTNDIQHNNLLKLAKKIHDDDREMCQKIGQSGLELIKPKAKILTHCNTGALATGGQGTALSVIYEAYKKYTDIHVYIDETRPLLQGSRLTAFELTKSGVPCTLLCDNAAAFLMDQKGIDIIITGADRIAENGDAANKIGTFSLSVLAKYFNIPFYIAAPSSTFDFKAKTKKDIPIEERSDQEVICGFGNQTAPSNIKTYNPAFDVTPFQNITGYITEKGVIHPPFDILK